MQVTTRAFNAMRKSKPLDMINFCKRGHKYDDTSIRTIVENGKTRTSRKCRVCTAAASKRNSARYRLEGRIAKRNKCICSYCGRVFMAEKRSQKNCSRSCSGKNLWAIGVHSDAVLHPERQLKRPEL
jgi:hypothetical protein